MRINTGLITALSASPFEMWGTVREPRPAQAAAAPQTGDTVLEGEGEHIFCKTCDLFHPPHSSPLFPEPRPVCDHPAPARCDRGWASAHLHFEKT